MPHDGPRESTKLRLRVMRRLQQMGLSYSEIARGFCVTAPAISHMLGRCGVKQRQREQRLFRASVMSRLAAAPYRWTLDQISDVWGFSRAKACQDIGEFRYANPRAA